MMFRKTFELKEVPANALLMTTAADKYQVWINGVYVGRGPVRTVGPQWVAYDSYQVAHLLRPGKNSIAALVFFHGRMNGFSQDQRAGFFAQMEMTSDSINESAAWGTDRTWKLRLAAGWRRDTKEVNACYAAFTEVCDLGADPVDWMKPEFDDSNWRAATVLADGHGEGQGNPPDCWSYLEPRPIPPLRESELCPKRVVRVAEAGLMDGVVGAAFPAERMMIENIRELKTASVEGVEHLVDGKGSCVVRSWISASAPRPENLIRNHACKVYGPYGKFAPPPSSVDWKELPSQIELGGVVREGESARLADGCLDLSEVCGKNFCGENPSGTAMVLVPFHLDQAKELAIGAGADWWVQVFMDGQTMIDTIGDLDERGIPKGKANKSWPPTAIDVQKKARIEAGNHLLAVRFMRGNASALLALSMLPTDIPESVADPVIILDFGRPVFAAPVITFDAPAGVVVDAGYGMNLTDGRVATVHLNTRHADRCISRAGRQTWHPFRPLTVFRYLQLVFRTNGTPVTIEAANVITLEYPVEERGSFTCSDPVLGKLWKAGVDTVYLHLEDTLVCDAIRERAFYVLAGELEQHYLAAASAWGK
ncbi:MAG: family 78 glycoside hydrolase catalytic domain, partial [Verrucomicrobia bacterium]|nr:family 78 glycoside hydrolase catalytic domain [Verrucomicrobiota bacterium]